MPVIYKVMMILRCDTATEHNWRLHHLEDDFVGKNEYDAQVKAIAAGWQVNGGKVLCPDCVAKLAKPLEGT